MSDTMVRKQSNKQPGKQSLLNKKTALAGLAAVALIGGGAAFAYPSGTDLTVSATAAPQGNQTQVLVTIQNSNPTCPTAVHIDPSTDTTFAAGQTTGSVLIPGGNGSHRVEVRTNCGKSEHAHANFTVVNAQASGPANSAVGKNYKVSFTGLASGSTVSSTATLTGSDPLRQVTDQDTADKRGAASTKFKLKYAGTWVISSMLSSGTVNSVTVNVS